MSADSPALPDPDAPWLTAKDAAQGPTFVYRVRYVLNEIEVLELRSREGNARLLVRPPDGGAEAWINCHEVFSEFKAARNRLVLLNEERVSLVEQDLARAREKLSISRRLFLADGTNVPAGSDDDDDDDDDD